jgi:hypothetical protein
MGATQCWANTERLPSGEALGASDLGRWASNRRSGRPEYED